jgi:hypothetical protein
MQNDSGSDEYFTAVKFAFMRLKSRGSQRGEPPMACDTLRLV